MKESSRGSSSRPNPKHKPKPEPKHSLNKKSNSNSASDKLGHYDLDGVSLDPQLGVVVSSSAPTLKDS